MKLTNKAGITLDGKWTIPETGKKNIDFIKSEDGKKVLGIDDQPIIVSGNEGFKVMEMDEYKGKRGYANLKFQKWERSLDHEQHFVLSNQQRPKHYFLLANEDKTMSVGEVIPLTTPAPVTPTKSQQDTTTKPTGGADSKTIKISAIFIQLLLLAELLMM